MDELIIGAISLVAICIIALAFLLAPCGNLRCYTTECKQCESGEAHLTKAVDNYKSGFGVDQQVDGLENPFGKIFSTPGARLFLILLPILVPILLLLYFFLFTDAGHMMLGVGMIILGLIIMLLSTISPYLYRILMPIGTIFFAMGVIMFTFS